MSHVDKSFQNEHQNIGRYIFILLILLGVVGGYFLLSNRTNEVDVGSVTNFPPKEDGPIVAFGDSLVSGVGAETEGGFVTMLSEVAGEPVLNFGRGGDTTELALSRVEEVIQENPKVVLVLLGGNDYLNRISKEETFANLKEIIERFQSDGSVVILLGVRGGLLRDSYQGDYRELAIETGSAYVPNVLDGLLGNDAYMDDAIHPNEAGHRLIAEKVYPILTEILKK